MIPFITQPVQKPSERQTVTCFNPEDYYRKSFRAIARTISGSMYLIQGPVRADMTLDMQRISSRDPRTVGDLFTNWPSQGFARWQILEYASGEVLLGEVKTGKQLAWGNLAKAQVAFSKNPVEQIRVELIEK